VCIIADINTTRAKVQSVFCVRHAHINSGYIIRKVQWPAVTAVARTPSTSIVPFVIKLGTEEQRQTHKYSISISSSSCSISVRRIMQFWFRRQPSFPLSLFPSHSFPLHPFPSPTSPCCTFLDTEGVSLVDVVLLVGISSLASKKSLRLS